MSALHRILDEIRTATAQTSQRDKGTRFEELVLQFLKHDPVYAEQYKNVWLWQNFPLRDGKSGTGIDIVCELADGTGYVAIQCKFYAEDATIQRSDIDSFLVTSSKKPFVRRIIVSTTANWSKNAEDAIDGIKPAVQIIGLADLENSAIDWAQFSISKPTHVVLKQKKELRPHQVTAVEAVQKGFATQDRGKMIMACGTGKTFTSLKIAERIAGKGGRVLFLVPSLSLMSQTLHEWTAESAIPLHSFAVCSDVKVGKHDESDPTRPDDIAIPATTDAKKLAETVCGNPQPKKMTVVFSTYHSIEVIANAQKKGMAEFDLVICDEAHRTTGVTLAESDESQFVQVHDADFIKAKKRLYMTATPRLYSAESKKKADEAGAELCSMDDETLYGQELYKLGFSEAVEKDLLSDYKVIVLSVSEKYISRIFQRQFAKSGSKTELSLDDAAKMIGCWNGLSMRVSSGEFLVSSEENSPNSKLETKNSQLSPLRRAVCFTGRIDQSKRFTEEFAGIIADYLRHGDADKNALSCEVRHVDGTMNALERTQKIQWLKESSQLSVAGSQNLATNNRLPTTSSLATSPPTLTFNNTIICNYEYFKIVSGLDSLAEINRLDRDDILLYAAISERRDIRDSITNAKGGGVGGKQHSRGTGEEHNGGVSPIPGELQRFFVRIGDAIDRLQQGGVSPGRDIKQLIKQLRRDRQVIEWLNEVSKLVAGGDSSRQESSQLPVVSSQNPATNNRLLTTSSPATNSPTCRILSNAKCLSEGVDVPALDAVIFLNPRKSQVDVVQSVGRVMRKAPGKEYGYIILPIAIPGDTSPEDALDNNERYKVVWEVLQALRAHDDRFDIMINQIELNKNKPNKIIAGYIGEGNPTDSDADSAGKDSATNNRLPTASSLATSSRPIQTLMNFEEIEGWRNALFAKIVIKCGEKRYWADWARDVAEIASKHSEKIRELLANEEHDLQFQSFLAGLRIDLNPDVTEDDAVEMLSQHLITKPVFDALFGDSAFTSHNPVSQAMERMIDLLEDVQQGTQRDSLAKFYASVQKRASDVDNAEGKQKIVIELYDKFFKSAFPLMAQRLGIVYTPVEVVDFILHSVDHILKTEFGGGFNAKGNDILDPFTGTGTFIVRLLQSGLIDPENLRWEYENEIHANELILLAYYIAAINIEQTFHEVVSSSEFRVSGKKNSSKLSTLNSKLSQYTPFPGIVLTDTFNMTQEKKLIDENSKRAKRQRDKKIRVIIGNPPYSAGQRLANDNNQNTKYPQLDGRIQQTYAEHSTATNKNSLYDSYIRSFRWASDRIGDRGIICFVSNGSYIDGNALDGFRKCLAEEFTTIYCFNLRGNQRTQGEMSRKEGGKIFGSGSRTPVAITLLVKNPDKKV